MCFYYLNIALFPPPRFSILLNPSQRLFCGSANWTAKELCELWVHTLCNFIAIICRFSFSWNIFLSFFCISRSWISFRGSDSMCFSLFQNFFSLHFVSLFFMEHNQFPSLSFHKIKVTWGVSNTSIWCIPYHLKREREKGRKKTTTKHKKCEPKSEYAHKIQIFKWNFSTVASSLWL